MNKELIEYKKIEEELNPELEQMDFSRKLYEKLKAYMDEHVRKGKRR